MASIGSRAGATVQDEACSLALFMRLSKAFLSSPRRALLNTESSLIISSSKLRKLGTVLPICATSCKVREPCLSGRDGDVLEYTPIIGYPDPFF